ncbi:MAG: hypothetical protein IPJ03_16980 [Ignavibacteriales bacterium]|nr:hypothetical protein [Ignavibacteriales bacterium]
MPDFWKGVALTLDLRPAANVISDSIIDNKKYQQELDKSLAEEQRKKKRRA